jgi:hypothetical protein
MSAQADDKHILVDLQAALTDCETRVGESKKVIELCSQHLRQLYVEIMPDVDHRYDSGTSIVTSNRDMYQGKPIIHSVFRCLLCNYKGANATAKVD